MIGSRRRGCVRSSGEKIQLIIRRLRCGRCRRIHHELPDILVPYKRHEALSIEAAVSEPPAEPVGVEESTLRRWRHRFAIWAPYAVGCLNALAQSVHDALPNPASWFNLKSLFPSVSLCSGHMLTDIE
ncbi:MAG TPA: hypothetical protein GX517_01490 [Alicyclobacillus sp.]|nr:hypothetical protein [Alicyclobacillus sp.]